MSRKRSSSKKVAKEPASTATEVRHRLSHRRIERALAAARAAGMPVRGFKVGPNGEIEVFSEARDSDIDEVESWLPKQKGQKGQHENPR